RLLVAIGALAALLAAAAEAAPSRPSPKRPFVGVTEPGLSRLAGNEVLVILGDPAALTLSPNGRASAQAARLAAVMSRHGLDRWRAIGAGPRAGRFLALHSARADFDARAAARELAATGAFRAVAPNLALRPYVVPNDPYIDPYYEWYVTSATAGVSLPA